MPPIRPTLIASACLAVSFFICGTAPAQGDDSPATDAPASDSTELPTKLRWYGWQTLISDGAALGLVVSACAIDDSGCVTPMLWLGGATYVFGAPTIHVLHGHDGAGGGSMLMRIVALPVGAFIGCQFYKSDGPFGCLGGFVVGGLGGGVAAATIDAVFLGYDEVIDQGAVRLVPWVDARHGRTGLALAGTF